MSTEENKSVVHRLYEEVLNRGDFSVLDQVCTPDFQDHDATNPTGDLEGIKKAVQVFRSAFPDLHLTIHDMVADGDKVAVRATMRGTHRGELEGMQPTGRQVEVESIEILQFRVGGSMSTGG